MILNKGELNFMKKNMFYDLKQQEVLCTSGGTKKDALATEIETNNILTTGIIPIVTHIDLSSGANIGLSPDASNSSRIWSIQSN